MPVNLGTYTAKHCYIFELKYLKNKATEEVKAKQFSEATIQLQHYATDKKLEDARKGAKLHLIAVQFVGSEMVKMKEI